MDEGGVFSALLKHGFFGHLAGLYAAKCCALSTDPQLDSFSPEALLAVADTLDWAAALLSAEDILSRLFLTH